MGDDRPNDVLALADVNGVETATETWLPSTTVVVDVHAERAAAPTTSASRGAYDPCSHRRKPTERFCTHYFASWIFAPGIASRSSRV